jgi:hypothetical protein
VKETGLEFPESDGINQKAIDWVIDTLRQRTYRRALNKSLAAIPDALEPDVNKNLSGQIWATITRKWGEHDGLHALAQALDGKFNITVRAVVDDIMEQRKHLFPSVSAADEEPLPEDDDQLFVMREEHLRVSISEEQVCPACRGAVPAKLKPPFKCPLCGTGIPRGAGPFRRAAAPDHPRPVDLSSIDSKVMLERFLHDHPEEADGITLLLSAEPLDQLAKARQRTVQTLINRKNHALATLRAWMTPA